MFCAFGPVDKVKMSTFVYRKNGISGRQTPRAFLLYSALDLGMSMTSASDRRGEQRSNSPTPGVSDPTAQARSTGTG